MLLRLTTSPLLQKIQPMALRGWREAMMAPTTENVSSVTRLTITLKGSASLSYVSCAPKGLAIRANEIPPASRATASPTSDHASHEAVRVLIPPTPRSRSFVPCVTTPLYNSTVSKALRQPLRGRG